MQKHQSTRLMSNFKNITMENTLENKAKFFAQYWGQNVLNSDKYGCENISYYFNPSQSNVDGIKGYNYHLLLKPLSSITDEDACHISMLLVDWQSSMSRLTV